MTVYCDNKGCIYHKNKTCTSGNIYYIKRKCQSYCNAADINSLCRSGIPRVRREHGRIKAVNGDVLK